MMDIKELRMWECMAFCNGQIRVKRGRYGGGWLAAGCAVVEWYFDDQWSCLTCGDPNYIAARDFFEQHEDVILIEHASTPREAFDACVAGLIATTAQPD